MPYLRFPPIKEAVISVSFKNTLEVEQLQKFCESDFIRTNYPSINNLAQIEIRNEIKEGKSQISSFHKPDGYSFNCTNNCNTSIQLRIGQLSFHNTNSYLGWEKFFNEFKNVWENFCKTVAKMDLINIAVRYINQLSFDLPLQNGFEEFLKLTPAIPDGISKNVNNFFIQLNVPNSDNTLTGVITETFSLTPDKKVVQVLLDISVVKIQNLICNSEEMWSSFVSVRQFKNDLFFHSITDKTKSKYE